MFTNTINDMYTTLPASHEVGSDSTELFNEPNKSSRWLIKRLEKAKESLRLSQKEDNSSFKAWQAKLVAKRAALKERESSSSSSRRISRISQEIKYLKPCNSINTESNLIKVQQLKKDIHKLKQRTKWNSMFAMTWSRQDAIPSRLSFNLPPSPKGVDDTEETEEADAVENLFTEKRKKKRCMNVYEDD